MRDDLRWIISAWSSVGDHLSRDALLKGVCQPLRSSLLRWPPSPRSFRMDHLPGWSRIDHLIVINHHPGIDNFAHIISQRSEMTSIDDSHQSAMCYLNVTHQKMYFKSLDSCQTNAWFCKFWNIFANNYTLHEFMSFILGSNIQRCWVCIIFFFLTRW